MKWLFVVAAIVVSIGCHQSEVRRPVSHCRKCGAEWIVKSGDAGDVDSCPLCPMTEDELRDLIEKIKEADGVGE